MVEKVILASPRGFCAGVVRAVDIVEIALDLYEQPIYVRREIIHNPHVVRQLSEQGAVFVENIEDVPEGQTVIFSAHGVSPEVWEEARQRSLKVIDATCPLVTKVHLEALRYSQQNYTVVLIGHEGHDEVIGTMGEAPEHIKLVGSIKDVEALEVKDPNRVSYITQTTLSLQDTREMIRALRERFPAIEGPPSEDICYATQNRQEAVQKLTELCDLILVVGATNSSNSNRLVEESKRAGTPAQLISDVRSIDLGWLRNVTTLGVTSGASSPESLVHEVIGWFREQGASVEELSLRDENVQFALPANLVLDLEDQRNPVSTSD